MDIDKFERHLHQLVNKFFPDTKIQNLNRRLDIISLRIQISEGLFIDVYYNAENGRLDFTTIKNKQRIFGYDNVGEWHYHPFKNPEQHRPCPKPTLEEMFKQTVRVINQIVQPR